MLLSTLPLSYIPQHFIYLLRKGLSTLLRLALDTLCSLSQACVPYALPVLSPKYNSTLGKGSLMCTIAELRKINLKSQGGIVSTRARAYQPSQGMFTPPNNTKLAVYYMFVCMYILYNFWFLVLIFF